MNQFLFINYYFNYLNHLKLNYKLFLLYFILYNKISKNLKIETKIRYKLREMSGKLTNVMANYYNYKLFKNIYICCIQNKRNSTKQVCEKMRNQLQICSQSNWFDENLFYRKAALDRAVFSRHLTTGHLMRERCVEYIHP